MRTLLALLSLGLVGCSTPTPSSSEAPRQPGVVTDAEAAIATRLYAEQGCARCHGSDLEGGSLGPALDRLRPYFDEKRLAAYVKDPEAFETANPDFAERSSTSWVMPMPAHATLELPDRQLLARWLLAAQELE